MAFDRAPGVSRGPAGGAPGQRPFFFVLTLFLIILNCSAPGREGNARLETRDLSIERPGEQPVSIQAEIAHTEEERERGLMFRKKVPDGEGMLFVFEKDQLLSFWMKDTLVPLSIAYIAADGLILEIHHMEPGNLRPVRSSRSARYALEVPQGWFNRVGVGIGDRLNLEGLQNRGLRLITG